MVWEDSIDPISEKEVGFLFPKPLPKGSKTAMKRLSVLFFIFVLIFSACATGPKNGVKTIHPKDNPELYVRIGRIGERLLPVMDDENRAKYRVAILDTPEVNAFADGPNFQIVFYKGLLDQFNDEELAYVYAHEVAHITLGHYGKRVAASVATSVVFSVAGVFVPGLGYLDWVANPLVTRGFSRGQEMDADRLAVKSIGQCCSISPEAAIRSLEKLEEIRKRKGYKDEDRTGILDTHPSLEERKKKIREAP